MLKLGSEMDDCFMLKGLSRKEDGGLVPNGEFDSRYRFVYLVRPLVDSLLSSDELLFFIGAEVDAKQEIKYTRLGGKLLGNLRSESFEMVEQYPDYCLNPYFDLFYTFVRAYNLRSFVHLIRSAKGDDANEMVRILNECVESIRAEAKSKAFKARLKSYLRSVGENFKGLTSYVEALFECHARMLVVRIDLSYLERYRGISGDITFEHARQHRRKLLDYLGKGRLGPLLGYAWKFENGLRKGLHFHMLLFFDGSKVWRDVVLARKVGEYWSSVATDGLGSYYNCNAFKDKYEFCGIGMIHFSNSNGMEGLKRIVTYMTKLDEFFKFSVRGVRSFGKGAEPKLPDIIRGRPRSISGLLLPIKVSNC